MRSQSSPFCTPLAPLPAFYPAFPCFSSSTYILILLCSRLSPPTQEELGSPALAFVRTICHLLALDSRVSDAVAVLRRQLLKLLHVREFGPQAEFKEVCLGFTLPDVICRCVTIQGMVSIPSDLKIPTLSCLIMHHHDALQKNNTNISLSTSYCPNIFKECFSQSSSAKSYSHNSCCSFCNDCRDLDLCRDDELARHHWNCRVCEQPYNQASLEQRLVLALQHRVREYQLQDLQCVRCKQVCCEGAL